ncbi:hypothetical protein C8Q78DRAFT_1072802 [Trametes maxima]|nr:hypothetical protein C8Q78DRAFT_1072802 [Trametes maxima]
MLSRCRARPTRLVRSLHTTSSRKRDLFDPSDVDRPTDNVDVCVVGAGPAGLSAAIRLKLLEQQNGREICVVVLKKGAEVGSHILSGAMRLFTNEYSLRIPQPPQMAKMGTYVVSLSRVIAWLGSIAEELGVEVYPGFAGKMEFRARVTLLAEGAHGSLSKEAIRRFKLREGRDPQTYGLGLKEVWRVDPAKHEPGKVVHSMGWPLDIHTYGGGWTYHMRDGLVTLGPVVGLDYSNPYLSPYRELQACHPDATRIAYGARVLNEGGLQSVPKLNFPGGALIGCSAGFVNVAKSWVHSDLHEVRNVCPSFNTPLGVLGGIVYSGIDTLLLRGRTPWTFRTTSGQSDAAHTHRASKCTPIAYPLFEPPLSTDILTSPVHLRVRRYLPAGEDAGAEGTEPSKGLATEWWVEDTAVRWEHVHANVEEFAGLLGRGCPAQVYEYVDAEGMGTEEGKESEVEVEKVGWGGKRLVINSHNCIHCKFCYVKVPTQDITWTVPEGGGGPKYSHAFDPEVRNSGQG